jgi:hypothetical protein
MAELREVFEMTTKQIEPDLDSWRKQEERQHRGARRRKIGALAVAAVTAVVAAIGIVWTLDTDDGAQERTPAAVGVSADLGPGRISSISPPVRRPSSTASGRSRIRTSHQMGPHSPKANR